VLNDVAADFLMNVGRTMRYMADHFSKSMTPEVCLTLLLNVIPFSFYRAGNNFTCIIRVWDNTRPGIRTVHQGGRCTTWSSVIGIGQETGWSVQRDGMLSQTAMQAGSSYRYL
jgi:hypothetical protein